MFTDISNYSDNLTIKELKEILSAEKEKEKAEQKAYIEFLRSYEGKYVVCEFNNNNGLVCQLEKDWWIKQQNVIQIEKSNIFSNTRLVNYLWLKSTNPSSIDEMKEISKEQYDLVVESMKSVKNIRDIVVKTLFDKK